MLISCACVGQEFGIAVGIKADDKGEQKEFKEKLMASLTKTAFPNAVIYDWTADGSLIYQQSEAYPELPIEKAIFIKQYIKTSDKKKPEIVTKKDTTGQVVSAHFNVFFEVRYTMKAIDVVTGEILSVPEVYELKDKLGGITPLKIDVKKYYAKKPPLSKSGRSRGRTAAIYEDYEEQLVKKYNECKKSKLSRLKDVRWKARAAVEDDIYPITINEQEDGLYKSVTIDMTDKSPLPKGEILNLFAKVDIVGKPGVDYITYVEVKSVEGQQAIGRKTFLQGKKKFSKKLAEHKALYGVTDVNMAPKIAAKATDRVNIALEADAANRVAYERRMLRLPAVAVVERGYEKELQHLRSMYKDERYIDYDMGDLQDKLVGVQYLLTIDKENVNVTDVATGQLVAIDKDEGRRNWFAPGYTTVQALNMSLMKISNDPIELLEVTDQSKDKVKKIRLYHPIGFEIREKLDITMVISEEVAGKTYDRKEFIGKGWVTSTKENPNFGVLKVNKKGRKAVAKAIADGSTLEFMYSIKRD